VLYIVYRLPHLILPQVSSNSARKLAIMDASTLFRGEEFKSSNVYTNPPEESTLQLGARNTVLMDMIYGILDQREGSTPPNFPPQVEYDLSKAKVLQWANSLPVDQSPVETPPAIYPEYHHSTPRSPTPVGSISSDSSGRESSLGPKTPVFSIPVPTTHKKFSCEKEGRNQQAAKEAWSGFLDDSMHPRSSSYSQTNSPPSLSPIPAMKATITSLADDFMPGFVPEFEDPPVEAIPKLVKHPTLRISTQVLPDSLTPTSSRRPELVYPPSCQPAPQAAHIISPNSSNHSPSPFRRSAEICRTALKDLGGRFSPMRHSMGPSAKNCKQLREHPHVQARHSAPASPNKHVRLDDRLRVLPRPPMLSVVVEERPRIPTESVSVNSTSTGKHYDSRERYRRMNSVTSSPTAKGLMTPEYLRNQARYSIMPLPGIPLQVSEHMLSPTTAPPSVPLQVEQTIPSPKKPPPSIPLDSMPAQIKQSLLPLPNQNFHVKQHKPFSDGHSLPVTARRTQKEIEAIPEPALVTKLKNPAGFGTNLGASDTRGLFAGEQGLQFTMSRRIITMSKIEWMIESPGGSRILKCYEQANSLSRKRDFFDIEGKLLFIFQRRIGSTRTAEAPQGGTLFIVENASLHCKLAESLDAPIPDIA
jgi:hypothetical protein